MQQLIILIVALALAGGVYLFLTISKKKNKEQTEENAVEMMTANEMINVKDIRNNCLSNQLLLHDGLIRLLPCIS